MFRLYIFSHYQAGYGTLKETIKIQYHKLVFHLRFYIQSDDGYVYIAETCSFLRVRESLCIDCDAACFFMYVSVKHNGDFVSKKSKKQSSILLCFLEQI